MHRSYKKAPKSKYSFRHVIIVVLTATRALSLLLSRQKNEKNHRIEGFVIKDFTFFSRKVAFVELIFQNQNKRKFVIPFHVLSFIHT